MQNNMSVTSTARTDLVIGLTYAVGTNTQDVTNTLIKYLDEFHYKTEIIKISRDILDHGLPDTEEDQFQRINNLMDEGNNLRRYSENYGILALAAIDKICNLREQFMHAQEQAENEESQGLAFIVSSLRHPEEVERLRAVYSSAFFLVAVNESEDRRFNHLIDQKNIRKADAQKLIKRDEGESFPYGQHTREVFEMADIHLTMNPIEKDNRKASEPKNEAKLLAKQVDRQVSRILDLIFGHPFITPTFDEYAMFMAYASSLRSADLSRQIGAVIANKQNEIIAAGANDVPQFGGGQYWPDPISFQDIPQGRDYMRGYDANRVERSKIVEDILNIFDFPNDKARKEAQEQLLRSSIKHLTEYSRPVHAEMAAIISCARSGIPLTESTLYCCTFPCHNCAKHIINAGIKRVVFIEPYPKSKTLELYNDSATITKERNKVQFEEFIGIGPRRFFDLFSLKLSSGRSIMRQNDKEISHWDRSTARLRCPLVSSYTERECFESLKWKTTAKFLQTKSECEQSTSEGESK